MVTLEESGFIKLQPFTISRTPFPFRVVRKTTKTGSQVAREYINIMKRLILASLLAVFATSGALGQQIIVTVPGGHDREWYEHHDYVWRDGQWSRVEGHRHHDGYWKDGHYYRYDEDRD